MKSFYLDHAATTPLDERVLDVMLPYMKTHYGNPSSMHHQGIEVKKAINDARLTVADLFGVSHKNVVFTSGGTESTNLAIRGYASKHPEKKEIIISAIEHHATLHTVEALERMGYTIHIISVDHEGFMDINELKKVMSNQTLMLSIIWANNEIGTIQKIQEIGEICHSQGVKLHVDAVQMVAHYNVTFEQYPIDFLTLSGHKFYGPKGVGALIMREANDIDPIIYGGHQELGLRSGTENVYGIIGLARALQLKYQENMKRNQHLKQLTESFKELLRHEKDIIMNGPKDMNFRLPGLMSLSFLGVQSQPFAFALDQEGIYVSTGSACLSNEVLESHVLREIGVSKDYGTIRLTFGKDSNIKDLSDIWQTIKKVYLSMREE